ncbi:chemotaxis protein CheB [Sorangium sp. So ce1182]|uniref:chemotaxis protein CheB n=1 Tax=Sorangium sp. So ce1182 TaxID=3133334 RepID=UPI003F62FCF7
MLKRDDKQPRKDIIVVGASAGGLEVLKELVQGLPKDLDATILVVLHLSPDGPGLVPDILKRRSALPVAHAADGEEICRGRIYIAPPDRHLLVDGPRLRLTRGPHENMSRPAVDPLFRSAALAFGARVIGVILTGRLDDGTSGLWAVKACGGTAVVQDPSDASYPSMPRSALQHVTVDHVAKSAALAPLLVRLSQAPAALKGGGDMPRELELEVKIAREENALALGIMDLGPVTPYTCPECHGVLVQLKEDGMTRFRCHTGHGYTLSTLLSEVTRHVEDSLWNAVRTIEESIMLMRHVSNHARDQGDVAHAELFDTKVAQASERVGQIRKVVLQHELVTGDLPNERARW